ncbi:MAG: glycosyltransferase, partial [Paraglaciecola sp.]|nr:glycosyltransferase [Paraglaciecola sp.]
WYLDSYKDVAAANVNALQHYLKYGRFEGRWPCYLEALILEKQLWSSDQPEIILQKLVNLFQHSPRPHNALAGWVLGRWYGSFGDWLLVSQFLEPVLDDELALALIGHQGPFLLLFEAHFWRGDVKQAEKLLLNKDWLDSSDKSLATNMLVHAEKRLAGLSSLYIDLGLSKIKLKNEGLPFSLDNITCSNSSDLSLIKGLLQPLVTVIIPCFNAENTIQTALDSLLNQSWKKLEIIVVDDASTDDSWSILTSFAQKDPRVKLKRHESNLGAYRARNNALSFAKGKYITVHDSDDWSHAQKIELQVTAITQRRGTVASVSHWVRADNELKFQRWRMEEGWIYRNVSSLMFKRSAFKRLGYWDNVSVNADTEYYYRILSSYGNNSIVEVLPTVPLSFGRASIESLSQTKASHLRTQFKGLRKDYHDAALAWHQSSKKLRLEALPDQRPFVVPPQMCRGGKKQRLHNLSLLLANSHYVDSQWYLERYPDIAAANVDPLKHFVEHGLEEGREINPAINLSGLAYSTQQDKLTVLENLATGLIKPATPIDVEGDVAYCPENTTILCVGHLVSAQTFGAERSFIDSLSMLSAGQYNVVVVLPSADNIDYIESIKQFCYKVVFQTTPWWHADRVLDQKVEEAYCRLIQAEAISAIYVNTLVLHEPLVAAARLSVKRIVHVRELPANDTHLCEVLGADPETIRKHCLEYGDYFFANSAAVLRYLNANEKVFVIPNVIDFDRWQSQHIRENQRMVVSILSSNLPKKGIEDLLQVAQLCEDRSSEIEFRIFGPDNEFTENWKKNSSFKNVKWCGYLNSTKEALLETDILLNLSHFQESFGRTVLEGMACGCAVVAYDWGAIPELIDESCGVLVPFRDIDAVVKVLNMLSVRPDLVIQLGEKGRLRARDSYSRQTIQPKLFNVLSDILT